VTHRIDDFPPHVQQKLRAALAAERAGTPPRVDVVNEHQARAARMGHAATSETLTAPYLPPALLAKPARGIVIGDPPIARRDGDTLWLSLAVVPRTKKNSRRSIAAQSAASVRFAHLVRALLAPHAAALGLPLPDRPYNCAALFHTDNDRSDTVGLMQALADALEPDTRSGFVGVLTDDRLIRTWDGTRQAHAPLRPGITLTLTPTP
jgi:hypothetical protein